jgi:DNA-binding MarR family transcriptional regulator
VNRAAEVGLVRRVVSTDDARVAYVELTDEGERRFAAAFRALGNERRSLREAIAHLDE